jgi:rod shape-determining protein MreD
MSRYLTAILLMIVASAIQGIWPEWAAVKGAKPDLILVVLIAVSLGEDPVFGAAMGFVAGLMRGTLAGDSLGSFIVSRTVTGFVASMVTTKLFGTNPLVPVLGAGALTFLCEGMFFLVSPVTSLPAVLRALLAESVYNSVLTLLAFWFLQQIEVRKKIKLARARFF